MRNPNAYGVPVYGAPSAREVERKPCSTHRPLCIDCGLIDHDPLSEEIMDAVRAYQKVIIDDIKFRQSMKNVHEFTDEQWEASSSHNRAVRDAADEIYIVIRKSLNIEEDDEI